MGAGQTKQKSVLQQVNDIVNSTVNKSSTSIKVNAQATQNINIQCTEAQLDLARIANATLRDSYTLALKYYYQNGAKGQPPKEPIELCSARDIKQKASVSLRSDAQSKESMANAITTELKSKATQVDDLMKTTSIVGYSETDKTTIAQIITNVNNSTLNETVLNIVNSAIVDQDIIGSGVGYSNISQESAVSLIAGAIIDNITNNINKSDLELENTQDSKQEEKSGQVESVKAVTSMISNVFKSVTDMFGLFYILLLLFFAGLVFAIFKFPGFFCNIPGLGITMKLAGLCSKNNQQEQQGVNPYQQGFNYQQGVNPYQQGVNPYQQGFNYQQGVNPYQQGVNPYQQGVNPYQQGFNYQQGVNPYQQGFNYQQGVNSQ
jgi:ubiquitin